MARRVVVTACSAITPIGHTKEDIVRHLVEGISGVIKLRADDLLSEFHPDRRLWNRGLSDRI